MKIPIYQIDTFSNSVFQGNPAAVCPLEEWLPDEILQSIAGENNLSETAFYVKKGDCFELRWFTPTKEVDLCGHATIATAHVLFEKRGFAGKKIIFHSRSGILKVERNGEYFSMDFPILHGEHCDIPRVLEDALGLKPREAYKAMDYMAVFEKEDDIIGMQPNFELLRKLDLRGLIVTAPGKETDFVCRFFAPNYGINEDPVTGSAYCMLTPFWSEKLHKKRLTAKQLSPRSGSLVCELVDDRVLISGKSVSYLEGQIEI